MRPRRETGIRLIAVFEAAKGLIVLALGVGLLGLVHRDVDETAARLVARWDLDPAGRYTQMLFHAASAATPSALRALAAAAALYATVRLIEAVGLWRLRPWAEWLGVATGAAYLPFEVVACLKRPGPEPILALVVNAAVVLYLLETLRARRRGAGIWRLDRSMF